MPGTSAAAISLIDTDRQWFKAAVGLGVSETPRGVAFCDHVIRSMKPVVVEDATKDARFLANPLVTGTRRSCSTPGCRLPAAWVRCA